LNSEPETPQETKRVTKTYSEGDKFKVLTTYTVLGSLIETAKETGVSLDTIKGWKKQAWWPRMMAQIKGEENAHLAARYRKVVQKTIDKLMERVEDGDVFVDKDGNERTIPIRGRDLAVIAGIATQQMEKLDQDHVREDTLSVTERLTKIAEELVKMHSKKRETITIDAEIVNGLQENQTQTEEVSYA
jgi:hypothetical protein